MNVHKVKQEICDIGRRIYAKGFAAANDGNISVRISDNEVLCTPTMHCKGFLEPEDIATVDMTGKQLAGRKKRSSEALLHLEIY
jgi:L-fuculose-phosphate aldolase